MSLVVVIKETDVKQDHTEESIVHTDGQQNTGNHKESSEPDAAGADKFGGTRAGASNVEPAATEHLPGEIDAEKT